MKFLIFNWKMNLETLKEAVALARASDYKNVAVAAPFPFLEEVGKVLKKADLAAQDLFWEAGGAFTGEVSAKELKSIGVKYVIVGHSERRHKMGETDVMIAKKLKTAVEGGLIPVLCVGETRAEKQSGLKEAVIKRQLEAGLSLAKSQKLLAKSSLSIAYEPVWAIGTGEPETPESALETIKYIKKLLVKSYKLKARVLYGGSVNSLILKDYLRYKEVDGALVGGASIRKEEVKKMVLTISQ